MSVIAHLRVPSDSFELGRILELESAAALELESMVPLGEMAVPFFSVVDSDKGEFERRVRDHPSLESLREVNQHDSETLYALEWKVGRDVFFQGLLETGAQLLSAKGGPTTWTFELRFPSHEALSAFQEHCSNADIPVEVGRIYNPTRPEASIWYGLTPAQRATLVRAVEAGYYSIPRRMSTQGLAEEFDISDQAVTERLRRAIVTLVENTLIATMEAEEEFDTPE